MKRVFVAALSGLLSIAVGNGSSAAGADQRAAEMVGASRSCVAHSGIVSSIVEDQQNIRFEMLGRRVYRNRLSSACPELRQVRSGFATLAFDLHGASICQGDLIRVTDLSRGRGVNLEAAIACQLGSFERLPDRTARR
jgi:hypothetical protein